jgi:hypothetical protein
LVETINVVTSPENFKDKTALYEVDKDDNTITIYDPLILQQIFLNRAKNLLRHQRNSRAFSIIDSFWNTRKGTCINLLIVASLFSIPLCLAFTAFISPITAIELGIASGFCFFFVQAGYYAYITRNDVEIPMRTKR